MTDIRFSGVTVSGLQNEQRAPTPGSDLARAAFHGLLALDKQQRRDLAALLANHDSRTADALGVILQDAARTAEPPAPTEKTTADGQRIVSIDGAHWLVSENGITWDTHRPPTDIPLEPVAPYETVHGPSHYDHPTIAGLQAIDVIQDFPYNVATAMAYLWRCGRKPGIDPLEDLRKARQHIDFELRRLEAAQKGGATWPNV